MAYRDWPKCDDCGEHLDPGQTLCKDCADRRFEQWIRYQDYLRMSRKDQEDADRWDWVYTGG